MTDRSAARARFESLVRSAMSATEGHLATEPAAVEATPRRRRWALRGRFVVAALVVLAVLAAAGGGHAAGGLGSRAVPAGFESAEAALGAPAPDDPPPEDPPPGEGVDPAPGEPNASTGSVVVHVAGQVRRPGVVELPAGSRVHEALAAAGGPTEGADLAAVNLARPLVDGEQVYVPAPGEEARPLGGPAGGVEPGAVNLNTAGLGELDALPGIGPVLAQRILDWRTKHGRFTAVEELGEVSGIGPSLLDRLRDRVTVG